MQVKFFIAFLLLPILLHAQGGLMIGNGAKVTVNGSPNIILNNAAFINDGDFTADKSTVFLKGNTDTNNATIGGTAITTFHHLNIAKSSNDVRLDFDIQVDGNLTFESGNLLLNQNDIYLEGSLQGEAENARVIGTTGGEIIKTLLLDMPVEENPGNLGAVFTAPVSLGLTTIRRGHVEQINGAQNSIQRYYDISPTINSDLDATLRFFYFDKELAGLDESKLLQWQYENASWDSLGAEDRHLLNNWVETTGNTALHKITLAENLNLPLPVELIYFDAVLNEQKTVDLFWTTTAEIDNDYFVVERSRDGIHFSEVLRQSGAGQSTQPISYRAVDPAPLPGTSYYRLRQVDFDGTYSLSPLRAVRIDLEKTFSVYPNPLKEVLHVVANGTSRGKATLEIFDALGRIKYSRAIELNANVLTIDIHEVNDFSPGNYFLSIKTGQETYNFNLAKVRE